MAAGRLRHRRTYLRRPDHFRSATCAAGCREASVTVADHDEEAEMVATRAFGDTGITVSEIGLGAWQLGRSADWPDGPDVGEAIRIVHAALDAGVTFIDTAPGYADGQSELNIGAALRGRSDEVVICTKFGHTPEGTTNWAVEAIGPSVRRSAERLGVDHIDIVVLHNPPAEILDGTRIDHYEALEELKQAGLIRAYGASVDRSDDVDLVLATTPSRALEVRMSALYQERPARRRGQHQVDEPGARGADVRALPGAVGRR